MRLYCLEEDERFQIVEPLEEFNFLDANGSVKGDVIEQYFRWASRQGPVDVIIASCKGIEPTWNVLFKMKESGFEFNSGPEASGRKPGLLLFHGAEKGRLPDYLYKDQPIHDMLCRIMLTSHDSSGASDGSDRFSLNEEMVRVARSQNAGIDHQIATFIEFGCSHDLPLALGSMPQECRNGISSGIPDGIFTFPDSQEKVACSLLNSMNRLLLPGNTPSEPYLYSIVIWLAEREKFDGPRSEAFPRLRSQLPYLNQLKEAKEEGDESLTNNEVEWVIREYVAVLRTAEIQRFCLENHGEILDGGEVVVDAALRRVSEGLLREGTDTVVFADLVEQIEAELETRLKSGDKDVIAIFNNFQFDCRCEDSESFRGKTELLSYFPGK